MSTTTDEKAPTRLAFERVCALCCVALSIFIAARAESLVSQSSLERSGAFPPYAVLWLGAGVLGLASLAWTVQLFRGQPTAHTEVGRPGQVLSVFVVLLIGAWSARWLGLLPAAGLTYVALMLYYRDRSKVFVFGSALCYLLLLHFGMEVVLNVPLPRSPILPLPF